MCLHLQHKNVVDSSLSSFVEKKRVGGGGGQDQNYRNSETEQIELEKEREEHMPGVNQGHHQVKFGGM
jgi:hypothetical protein